MKNKTNKSILIQTLIFYVKCFIEIAQKKHCKGPKIHAESSKVSLKVADRIKIDVSTLKPLSITWPFGLEIRHNSKIRYHRHFSSVIFHSLMICLEGKKAEITNF